ncbi:hypothetical protein SeLEV6574_g07586 [Synchytrium endobioticum]|uniref:Major facilitator superfamily (MFS) profile domain-containing protein n=1 Tax=Synchytrium endobioticum TaxID=286115 RepID=A0A507CHP7_9FUNG|nr:hypothetical protein SeLEV6574_g07586 [Synchytrium endobioticum]
MASMNLQEPMNLASAAPTSDARPPRLSSSSLFIHKFHGNSTVSVLDMDLRKLNQVHTTKIPPDDEHYEDDNDNDNDTAATAASDNGDKKMEDGIVATPMPNLSGRRVQMKDIQWFITMFGILAANLLFSLASSAVPISNQSVSKDLSAGAQFVWVTVAFLPPAGALQPLLPTLANVLGTRNLSMFSGVLWIAGSLLSATATSFPMFCVGRGLTGAAFGGCILLPYLILIKITSVEERAQYTAYLTTFTNIGNFLGPIVGGVMIEKIGWRAIYSWYIPPILFMIMPAFFLGLRNTLIDGDTTTTGPSAPSTSQRFKAFVYKFSEIDWLGTVCVTAMVICVQMVFSYGAPIYGWGSWVTVAFLGGSISLFLLLVLVELNVSKKPIIPKQVFSYRNYNMVFIYLHGMRGSLAGSFFFLPIFMQIIRNNAVLLSGLLVAPMALGVIIGSLIASAISKRHNRNQLLLIIGSALSCIGFGCFSTLEASSSDASISLVVVVIGVGLGFSTMTNFVFTIVTPRELTHGGTSAAAGLATAFGGVFVSVLSSATNSMAQSGFNALRGDSMYMSDLATRPVISYASISDLPQPLRDQA